MPIHYSRTKFSGRLNLNRDVRPVLEWVSPEELFAIPGLGTINVPFVMNVVNLPQPTFEIISGTLPAGLTIQGAAIVGEMLGVASSTHEITIRAKSRHVTADRTFTLAVVGGDYDFHWITEAGLIDADEENTETSAFVLAHDPLGLPITYRRSGGPIPQGVTINPDTGAFEGTYPFVTNDVDYTFLIEASNGLQTIEREFIISVFDSPSPTMPVFETPKGLLDRLYEGMTIDQLIEAVSPNGEEVTYEIVGGSPPIGSQLFPDGKVFGLLAEVTDDTTFRILIGATNDGGETYTKRLFEIVVLQNWEPEWVTPIGVVVAEVEGYDLVDIKLEATDRNSPDQTITYEIMSGTLPFGISLDPNTGALTGTMPQHFGEETQEFPFTVRANDGLKWSDRLFTILNQKDLPPVFGNGDVNYVEEYFGLEKEYLETALNPATDPNGKPITYSITAGALPPGFQLNPVTGSVFGDLPAAPTEDLVYDFVLTAADRAFNANLKVRITSWMNTAPVWQTTTVPFGIEGKPYLFQLAATDRELKPVTFFHGGGNFPNALQLDSDGRVFGNLPMIAGQNDEEYTFTIMATDGIMTAPQSFTLVVQKNLPPVWVTNLELGSVMGQKTFSFPVVAVDPNEQPVTYQLISLTKFPDDGTPVMEFQGDPRYAWKFNESGSFSGLMPNTFTNDIVYTMTVAALDGDHSPTDHPQVLRAFTFTRAVNTPPVWITPAGPLVPPANPDGSDGKWWEDTDVSIQLEAVDPEGMPIRYSRIQNDPIFDNQFLRGNLRVTNDGRIVGHLPYGLEDRVISFYVDADDLTRTGEFDSKIYTTRQNFSILVSFNAPPSWLTPGGLLFKRVENENVNYTIQATGNGNLAAMVYSVKTEDDDGNPLPGLPIGLSIVNPTNGDIGRIVGQLERVTEDKEYTFTLVAFNGIKKTEREFTVIVEKNITPEWVTPIGEIAASLGGILFSSSVSATDANEGRGRPLNYTLSPDSQYPLPAGITLNPVTGALTGRLPVQFDETVFPFTLRVDDGLSFVDRNFSIRALHNEAPVWSTQAGLFAWPLDDLNPYSTAVIAVDPEEQPLTYTLTSGTMPPGLTFNPDGTITGETMSVTQDEDYPFTVEVDDGFFQPSRNFVLKIVDNLPPVWNTPAGLLDTLIAGYDYTFQLDAEDAYGTELKFTLQGSLPPGLSLQQNGLIRGKIPKEFDTPSLYQFFVTVSDGVFDVVRSFEIDALQNRPALWGTDAGELGTVHVNDTISYTLIATDDHNKPLSFTRANGDLPSGISQVGNVISGTVGYIEPRNFGFTMRVSDEVWEQTDRAFSIRVLNDPPEWQTGANLGIFNEQTEISLTIEAIDPEGWPSVTYQEVSGIEGLTLNSGTGVISGTLPPITEDTIMEFTATAKDDHMFSAPRTFLLDVRFVSPPVWQSPTTIPTGTEQFPYSFQLEALSNNQIVTYEIVGGEFPSTLNLSPDGLISGTAPVIDGDRTYTFEVEAKAGTNKRSSQSFTFMVRENLPPAWTTPEALPAIPNKTQGYTFNFTATDPNGNPLVYSLVGGVTPPGLTFDFGPDNTYATLSGNIGSFANDTPYVFMLGADDSFIRTDRTFSVTVLGNRAPVWNTPAGIILEPDEGSSFSFTLAKSDADGDALTVSLLSDEFPVDPISGQKVFTFDASTGTVSGTVPSLFNDVEWKFTARVTDADGKFADREFIIKGINNTNRNDPYSQYVSFMLPLNNGQIRDEIQPTRTIQAINYAVTTTQPKFGNGSLGNSGYLFTAVTDDINISTAVNPEYCIELWIYPTNNSVAKRIVMTQGPASNSSRATIQITNGNGFFDVLTGSGDFSMSFGAIPINQWTHLALSRGLDGTLRAFKNGIATATRNNSVIPAIGPTMSIGGDYGTSSNTITGYIDDVRITRANRYDDNFVVPSSPNPIPPRWTTDALSVISTGVEEALYSTGTHIAIEATAIESDVASAGVKYYPAMGETYDVDEDLGIVSFPSYPSASDQIVKLQAMDGHGNLNAARNFIVRATQKVIPELKVQWRFDKPVGSTPVAYNSVVGGVNVLSTGGGAAYVQAPAPYTANTALKTSTRMNYEMANAFTFMSSGGAFTVEMWVYPTSLAGDNNTLLSIGGTGMRILRYTAPDQFISSSVNNRLSVQFAGVPTTLITSPNDVIAGQWNHIAVTRSGGVARLFVNGVGGDPVTYAGGDYSSQTFALNGFSSTLQGEWANNHMRAVNFWSVNRYPSNFTPTWPAFGLEPQTGGDLLWTHNRPVGSTFYGLDRGNPVATISGTASYEAFSPSLNVINYAPNSRTVFNSGATDMAFVSGDFTFETWQNTVGVSKRYQTLLNIGGDISSSIFRLYYVNDVANDASGLAAPLGFLYGSGGSGVTAIFPGANQLGVWQHLAIVKTGNNLRCYRNGVGGTPVTVTPLTTAALASKTVSLNGYSLNGDWSGNVKYSQTNFWKSAKYSANFTPPPMI